VQQHKERNGAEKQNKTDKADYKKLHSLCLDILFGCEFKLTSPSQSLHRQSDLFFYAKLL
jgi:hypothetical protein